MTHSASQTAKVVGELADKPPVVGQKLKGLLVKEGFDTSMMHPSDLTTFTGLHTGEITHRQVWWKFLFQFVRSQALKPDLRLFN